MPGNEFDLKLVRELRQDSRQSNTALAQKLGVSEATVRRHLQNLVKNDVIRFTAVVYDPKALGFQVAAFMEFSVDPIRIDKISDQLTLIESLYSVSVVAGGSDILASGYFKSVTDIYDLITNNISKIKGINKIETMIILKRKKREY